MLYDAEFYEYRALTAIADKINKKIKINYRFPDYSLPISRRIEFDGFVEEDSLPIEIKSYPLDQGGVNEIVKKFRNLNFHKSIIVAPKFLFPVVNNEIEFVEFEPWDTDAIRNSYMSIDFHLPITLQNELISGKHNFRFRLAKRGTSNRSRYLNQVDKCIDSLDKIKKEIIQRIPKRNSPIKILWSVKRWLSPKDHYYAKRTNVCLGGPIVFDIDGPDLHRAFTECAIKPKEKYCEMCIFFSKREVKKLISILHTYGIRDIEIFFSGKSGFHVYVFNQNHQNILSKITEDFMRYKITTDLQVTQNEKANIAFPGSINAFTGFQLIHVPNIDMFNIFDL